MEEASPEECECVNPSASERGRFCVDSLTESVSGYSEPGSASSLDPEPEPVGPVEPVESGSECDSGESDFECRRQSQSWTSLAADEED